MRFDDEHAYDQKKYDTKVINEHLIPEMQFKKLMLALIEKQGSIKGMYWLEDVVCALNPKEFPEERIRALKQLTLNMYTRYDVDISPKQKVVLLKAAGYGTTYIAKELHLSRQTVYYYLEQNEETPTCCMLTYGEYNLMMDFMDCWHELCAIDKIEKEQ